MSSIALPFLRFIFVLLSILLAACSKTGLKDISRDTVIYCAESDPEIFNPQLNTSSTTADVTAHQIYDRLIEFDPETGKIVPGLASSWSVSQDGLTYTFQLRRNVAFHTTDYFTPTRYFNASDVLFSIDRWRLTSHPFHTVSGGRYPFFDSLKLKDIVEHVIRVNGYRVELKLKRRDSAFLANLASDFSVILSAEYAKQMQDEGTSDMIDVLPIGTGPFKYQHYVKGRAVYLKRHANYWSGTDSIANLLFDITPRSALRLAKLITGECDAIAFPAQSELEVIRDSDELYLDQAPVLNIGYWAFNAQKPPFDDPNVRRALSYAIDKDILLDAVYLGNASRAKTLIPIASWAYNSDVNDTSYNPILARKMLDDAGVMPGFKMNIWALPVQRAYNPNAQKMAELIQQFLSDVQIDVEIESSDWNSFREGLLKGEHDSVLIGWSADNGDPDNFYRPLLSCDAIPSGTNRAMWCDQRYDELIYRALETENIDERKQIYQQVNQLLFEEIPLVPIAHSLRYQAFRRNIEGLQINPYGALRFADVRKLK